MLSISRRKPPGNRPFAEGLIDPEPGTPAWWAGRLAELESRRPLYAGLTETLEVLDEWIAEARAKAEGQPSALTSAWPPDSDTVYWDGRTAFDAACEAAEAKAANPGEAYDAVRALPPISGGSPAVCEPPLRKRTRKVADRPFEPTPEQRLWWTIETDRLERESLERQYEASREMDAIEAGLTEFSMHDGRANDLDVMNMGACG